MNIMTKAFLLSGSALASAGLFMTLSSAAMAQEATFVLPAGELGATSYNPITSSNLNSATSLIYDRLVVQDADQTFHPHLATSWEESPDGMTWVFKLHDGVKFHNGEPFNAETIAAWVPNFAGTENAFMVEAIDKVEVVDAADRQVRHEAARARTCCSTSPAPSWACPSPKSYKELGKDYGVTDRGRHRPVQARELHGRARRPCSCATTTTPGPRSCRRTRAPAKIAKITFREIPDQSTAFLELKTGGVDVLLGVPTDFLSIIKAEKAATVITMPGTGINYMPINTSVAPFTDIKVRAGDRAGHQPEGDPRQRLRRHRPGGAQLPDQLAAGIEGRSEARHLLRPRQGRPAARRSRLEGGRRRHARQGRQAAQGQAWTQNDTEFKRLTEVVQAQLKAVGMEAEITVFDSSTIRDAVQEERAPARRARLRLEQCRHPRLVLQRRAARLSQHLDVERSPKSDELNKIAMTGSKTSDERIANFTHLSREHAVAVPVRADLPAGARTSPINPRRVSVPEKIRGPRFRVADHPGHGSAAVIAPPHRSLRRRTRDDRQIHAAASADAHSGVPRRSRW